jgi:hypothetical protein
MRLPPRLSADLGAGLLLASAAAVLLATPYDGDSCRNVAAAYALPASSLPHVERPKAPVALSDAYGAVDAAEAEAVDLSNEQAQVDEAYAAAEEARAAATEAESDLWASSYSPGYYSSADGAELDVEIAEGVVESAEDWLEYVQEEAADTSEWALYDQGDVADAQEDLDEARAELAEAEDALAQAEREDSAAESAAANAEATAENLDAAADAAEQAAADAATDLASRQAANRDRLYAAQSRVAELETDHAIALAEWSHERRVAADEVTALNNVRDSCRENGSWRAGVALLDVVLVAALVLRRWTPRLPQWRPRLPWPRR